MFILSIGPDDITASQAFVRRSSIQGPQLGSFKLVIRRQRRLHQNGIIFWQLRTNSGDRQKGQKGERVRVRHLRALRKTNCAVFDPNEVKLSVGSVRNSEKGKEMWHGMHCEWGRSIGVVCVDAISGSIDLAIYPLSPRLPPWGPLPV